MKFLIAIEEVVGLEKFDNADYSLIQIDKMKPLFLVFVLELFWKNNIQNNYFIAQRAL